MGGDICIDHRLRRPNPADLSTRCFGYVGLSHHRELAIKLELTYVQACDAWKHNSTVLMYIYIGRLLLC